MATSTAAAAILVLGNGTVFAADVISFSSEITFMTARAVGCPSVGPGKIVAIPDKGRKIRGVAAFTGSFTRSVVTRVLSPIE